MSGEQRDLFSPTQAQHEAMERVDQHANERFKRYALAAGRHLAKTRPEFNSCDVRDLVRTTYPEIVTHEDRVMGPIMRQLAREGVIEKTDRVAASGRVRNNNRPVAIWRSLIL